MATCDQCGERVYRVQNAQGFIFWVGSFTGTRWCRHARF